MPDMNPSLENPEGIDRFDPMDDPDFAASVQAYSDRFRRLRGRAPIRLWEQEPTPESEIVVSAHEATAKL